MSAFEAVARGAVILFVLIVLGYAVFVLPGVLRRRRQPDPDPLEVVRNTHDWNCDAGAWPHDGRCIAAPEREFSAWIELARCEYLGLGNTVRVPEDDYCTGAGE